MITGGYKMSEIKKEKVEVIDLSGEYLKLSDEINDDEKKENKSNENDSPEINTSELIIPIVKMAVSVIVPNWKVSDDEVAALSVAYALVLDKYFPDTNKLMGVEFNALLMTSAIVLPRIGTPAKKENKKEPENKKEGK